MQPAETAEYHFLSTFLSTLRFLRQPVKVETRWHLPHAQEQLNCELIKTFIGQPAHLLFRTINCGGFDLSRTIFAVCTEESSRAAISIDFRQQHMDFGICVESLCLGLHHQVGAHTASCK